MTSTSGVIKLQRLSSGKLRQARDLRKNMTEAEGVLWKRLRRKSMLGVKFRRQQIIEGFIADFFCETSKLVVEVDGEIHELSDQKKKDEHRRNVFAARGLKELRFSNKRVLTDINGVLQEINGMIEKK